MSVKLLMEELLSEGKLPEALKDDKFKKGETEASKNASDVEKVKKGEHAAVIEKK
jgi:hypothetical protein